MKLASRLDHIAPFQVMAILAKARALEAAGRDIIHLEVGEPDFATPAPIVAAGQRALAEGHTFYTAAQGLTALRVALAQWYQQRHGVVVSPERIIITTGASSALQLALGLLVEPGSEMLLADPTYPCNRHFVSLFGGTPVALPVGPDTRYQPSAAQVATAWSERTAGLMLASPGNPTGTLLPSATLAELVDLCRARGGALIVDEIYQGLTYGVDAETALRYADDVFVINSFSKYFQMTGWRLGWLVVPEGMQEPAIRLAQNLFLCPPAPAQHAALAAFEPATLAILEQRRAEFARRRDFLLHTLPALGWQLPLVPEGAFYLYADVSAVTDDSFAYCQRALDEVGVAITPGNDFGVHGARRHVRVAYTTGVARLAEAVERLASLRA